MGYARRYKGFVRDTSTLPIKAGDMVTIPKGTPINTTKPGVDVKLAGRSYSVRVHSIGSGRSYHIGHVYSDGTRVVAGLHWRDMYHACRKLGVDYPYGTTPSDDWLLEELEDTGRLEIRGTDILLHMDPPTVTWVGSGGYWMDCDINWLID